MGHLALFIFLKLNYSLNNEIEWKIYAELGIFSSRTEKTSNKNGRKLIDWIWNEFQFEKYFQLPNLNFGVKEFGVSTSFQMNIQILI